jgi:GTP-binding protein Era
MAEAEPGPTRCGFVALVGAPNAGKSTLLNTLVGTKVSIVTPKVQTTRTRVLGIAISGQAQIAYVDTPGIFTPRRRLERAMVRAAWTGAADADLVVFLVDAARAARRDGPAEEDLRIAAGLKEAGRDAILALNKIDQAPRASLLWLAERLNLEGRISETFMISALDGDGVRDLEAHLAASLPEGPWLFPEDQLSDMPLRLMAAEITREKLFLRLRQELPYAIAVETEEWQERKDGSVRIGQVVYVQRDTQKAIVLGKGGHQIKAVGAAAREELERLMERRVHLFLFVKVREHWLDDSERYRDLGLDYGA